MDRPPRKKAQSKKTQQGKPYKKKPARKAELSQDERKGRVLPGKFSGAPRKGYTPASGSSSGASGGGGKPPVLIQPTTLWDYPSQHYGDQMQGDKNYVGATPSYIIWNLLKRYTKQKDVVVDPCCGSGTTLDVCKDLNRFGQGFDIKPARKDIQQGDARQLPLDDETADFVFIDPPYSNHLDYSDHPDCIGKTKSADGSYYDAMAEVFGEIDRVLKPGGYMALYVSDSYVKGKAFHPIGFHLFANLMDNFEPVDIVSVTRHNKTLAMGNYRMAAEEGNFYLRGFNYLFIMHKAAPAPGRGGKVPLKPYHGSHLPEATAEGQAVTHHAKGKGGRARPAPGGYRGKKKSGQER